MSVEFVAEVSSNHHRDLKRCFAFIDKAAEVGCDAVKFQLFRIDELFAPEILAQSERHRKRREWELPVEFLPHLAERSRKAGLTFSCTPFYIEAVDQLYAYVDFYKVASYELLWHDLLKTCARTGKPLVLSTGMATLDEIEQAVNVAHEAGCSDLTLLHCVSGYPTPIDQCNLGAIETIRKACQTPVGWSDHSVKPAVIQRAVQKWGATMIEFHLDLDGEGDEFNTGHCWLPEQIAPVITALRTEPAKAVKQDRLPMDGDGRKVPAPSEIADRDWRADPIDGLRPMLKTRKTWKAAS